MEERVFCTFQLTRLNFQIFLRFSSVTMSRTCISWTKNSLLITTVIPFSDLLHCKIPLGAHFIFAWFKSWKNVLHVSSWILTVLLVSNLQRVTHDEKLRLIWFVGVCRITGYVAWESTGCVRDDWRSEHQQFNPKRHKLRQNGNLLRRYVFQPHSWLCSASYRLVSYRPWQIRVTVD